MVLLDTCTLLWLASDRKKLPKGVLDRIAAAAGALYISSISAFEIALKHRRGRLVLPMEPEAWIGEALAFHGIEEIPVDWRITARAVDLAIEVNDPCDRMILATALLKNLTLLSPDQALRACPGVSVAW